METAAVVLFKKIAKELGHTFVLEPHYNQAGYIENAKKKRIYFRNNTLDVNTYGAIKIAKDKEYCRYFLRKFGFTTARGTSFFNERLNSVLSEKRTVDYGYDFARKIGFPVVVKPNNSSQGRYVFKAYTKQEFYMYSQLILTKTSVAVVERWYPYHDVRIVVFDGKVYAAYMRKPLAVVGNGTDSLQVLLEKKACAIAEEKNLQSIPQLWEDVRLLEKLKHDNRSIYSIPKANEKIILLENANLSAGGEAVDVTKTIHRSFCDIAVEAAKSLNLRIAGIDILAKDMTKSAREYVVLEVNGSPGLENYMRLSTGAYKRTRLLYTDVIKKLCGKT